MQYFLIDNGSLRSASILKLRQIAGEVSRESGFDVLPFGLMHSHRVKPEDLEGRPAGTMQQFLLSDECSEVEEIRALPFFLGPSLAITDWLPDNLGRWRSSDPGRRSFRILPPLFEEGDDRLALALADFCRLTAEKACLRRPRVALVDHGTPLTEVNQVREKVGERLRDLLGDLVGEVATCCMERRPEAQFDFNDPLLENLLEGWVAEGVEEVVVAQFFLLPGRHAGPGGDLAEICQIGRAHV